jgi:hypothetical protein
VRGNDAVFDANRSADQDQRDNEPDHGPEQASQAISLALQGLPPLPR